MRPLIRNASIASFIVFLGMIVHNINARWLEPTYLNFKEPTDYANMENIANAGWSFSFTSSGITHMFVGFSLMMLGLGIRELFKDRMPNAAQVAQVASIVGGMGFLLTGIADIPGKFYADVISEHPTNLEYGTEILLMLTLFRGLVNIMGITGLGWLAGMISYMGLKTGRINKWLCYYGYLLLLPAIVGLGMPFAGFAYLSIAPIWAIWLGFELRKSAGETMTPAPA